MEPSPNTAAPTAPPLPTMLASEATAAYTLIVYIPDPFSFPRFSKMKLNECDEGYVQEQGIAGWYFQRLSMISIQPPLFVAVIRRNGLPRKNIRTARW
jgi:hypothetical protein